jgi:hypothetical protein
MTVKAGQIVTVAGHTVVQRLQTQGLGNARVPINTIREIGNNLVVDKVPGEPDFTFAMESLAVDCTIEAILHGQVATGSAASQGAGQADAPGTAYDWSTVQQVNITSPWKDPQSFSSGVVNAGVLVPGYFPQKLSYKFGVTENASQNAELRGGSFFYGNGFAPTEDVFTGDGSTSAFVTSEPAVQYRRGGALGTTFQNVFGVLVNGVQQVEGEDYTVAGGGASPGTDATITFLNGAPANGAKIKVAYFTSNAHAFPQAVSESALVLPGAVRGRNVKLSMSSADVGSWQQVYGVQTFTLDAMFDITPERELNNDEIIGFTVNGTDVTGTVTMHPKDKDAFFNFLQNMTGVNTRDEVVGWLNMSTMRIKLEIFDPRNPGSVLKTLYVSDARFDIPATPARVNTVVDFSMEYGSLSGDYTAYKGAAAGI